MYTKTIRFFPYEIVKSQSHCKSFQVFYCKRISFLFYLEEIHARENSYDFSVSINSLYQLWKRR